MADPKVPCGQCRGTGRDPMSDIVNWLPCPTCKGSGQQTAPADAGQKEKVQHG